MCVAVKDRALESKLMVTTVALILLLLAGDFLVPAFLQVDKLHMVVAIDLVAFGALCRAIQKTR